MSNAVKIIKSGPRGMITLRGDLSSAQLIAAILAAVGLEVPAPRKINHGSLGGVAWMSPDELLLLVDHDKAESISADISKILQGEHHMVVNVSDARAVFRIEGRYAREVLAKGAPVDMSHGVFEKGEIRRTRIGQLAAAFWTLDGETFEVVCFRSVGGFLHEWLANAASEGSFPEYF